MAIRDDEATDADLIRRGTGLVPAPGTVGAAVVGPSVSASQKRVRDDAAARTRPLGSRRWFVVVGGATLPVVLLLAWQIATATGLVPVSVFPSPAMVWAAGVDLAQRGDLGQDIAISTQRVLIGFALGSVLGLVVGALFGLSRIWEVVLGPTLGAIRAVPSLAWVPLLLLWMGIGEESKITLITIGAFFPVFTTVATALGHVDRHLVEAGRAFGLSGVRLFTTVQLPAVIPSVISGLRLALAQSWLFLVASELIASSMGLGFRLIDSQNNGRIDRVFLAIILLAVLGKLTDAVVGVFQRYAVRKWA
ncbi:ABC transporter permease [Rathayibacter tanaceti]|uniref:ABC transporter permease subunit n=2 Tax=Rathayibacter tanaceti TaxID=1671680 RepID=A0A166HN06_9MICO|nr:ABC transporter permease [Rathayibacter tanaceti]KZX20886.1 putative aliphatic sulfonates transport permease protein SsuC [Rathayibacter tanaceti]QHC54303.1 ABC transporter permease subunit [Rathayibacter tanaceti]TCO37983.1 sulfonate transport system permease protein [Rathayibacter tanaceti]